MNAAFYIDEKRIPFSLSDHEPPPERMTIVTRKCPKSPALVCELAYDYTDDQHAVVMYRVASSRPYYESERR